MRRAIAMWEWTLNWNRIRPDLVIGSCPMTTVDIDQIHAETGATAILSLQSDVCREHFGIDYEEHQAHGTSAGLVMMNAPMLDFDAPDQRRTLPQAVRSLHDLLAAEHRVYLHCTGGYNRSPLAALGYLTFVERQDPGAAFELIRGGRPQADPSWEAYWGCRDDLIEMFREDIEVRAYYTGRENPEATADANWFAASGDVIRWAFTNGFGRARRRLDPNRA